MNVSTVTKTSKTLLAKLRWLLGPGIVCCALTACQTPTTDNRAWAVPAGTSSTMVNGYPLTYTSRGVGPTVVFVHGVLVDYRYWQTPLESWTSEFRVVAPSLRHFYPEPWNGKGNDFTIRQHARDLIALIESMGEPVYLVGWSYGGSPAYEVARARPDLVKKLVLVEGGPDLRPALQGTAGNADQIKRAELTAKLFDAGDMDGGLKFALDDINGPGLWDSLPEPRRQALRDNAWTVVGIGREVVDKVSCSEFASLQMPVLLIWAERTTPRLRAIVEAEAKCLPRAQLAMIPKAGHPSPSMNPTAFRETVAAFLKR